MRKIAMLIGDYFKDASRPIEDTSAGYLEHNQLVQAIADPKKVLTTMKAETQALATELTGLETLIGTGQAVQHTARELTADEFDKALTIIRENESALRNRYVVKEAKQRKRLYSLFYPKKMAPYNAASYKTMPGIARTYLDLVETEKDNLGEDIYTHTVADLTPFAEARTTQTIEQQKTSAARKKRLTLLDHLTEQLTANLHTLCGFYRPDKTQVLSFYNPRYFEVQVSAQPGHYAARVAPRHTNQVLDVADAQLKYTTAKITVKEEGELCFFQGDDGQTPVPADALRVSKATPLTVLLADLPGSGALLLVANTTAYVGHYVIELS